MNASAPAPCTSFSPWILRPGTCDVLLVQAQASGTLAVALDRAGIRVDFAYTRVGACTMVKQHRYTIVLVLGRPGGTLLASLRKAVGDGIAAPLVVLLLPATTTVSERLAHHVQGVDVCLDDWTDIEIVTRIQAWERRRYGTVPQAWLRDAHGPRLHVGPHEFVYLGNLRLTLPPMQRAILAAIIAAGEEGMRPVSLCRRLASRSLTHGSIRVHICSIRKALLSYQHAPRLVSHAGHYRIEQGPARLPPERVPRRPCG